MKALVRRPSPRLAEGIVTHLERRPIDAARALGQWEAYLEALRSAGWEPVELPPADDCPDGVFVEDVVVVRGDVAVLTLPGAEQRRAELDGVEEAVAALGLRIERIEPPGTLDGGDVLQTNGIVYVGRTARTNDEGIRQLTGILEPRRAKVIPIPTTRVLHLKSAVTALPDGTVIGYLPNVDDAAAFPRFLDVPEEPGAHVVLLGGRKLLHATGCPRTAKTFDELGYERVEVEITEFEKLEGGVTCLSVLVEPA